MDKSSIDNRMKTLDNLIKQREVQIEREEQELQEFTQFLKDVRANKEIFTAALSTKKNAANQAVKKIAKKNNKPEPPVVKELTEEEIVELKNYRREHHNKEFLGRVLPLAKQIPLSNGSRFYDMDTKKIGIISDEFFYHSFEGMADLTYINKTNYTKHTKLDFLLVVTTWKGLDMDWKGLGNPNIKVHRETLYDIIDFYKARDIPSVFFSKEDPVNYEVFVDVAKRCEYIFTTAVEKVESYKADCKNDNVFVWAFGINPLIHNPVGIKKFEKEKGVLFAGSWYYKYPERQIDTRMVFDGIIKSNQELQIVDRNFDLHLSQYLYPKEYTKYTSPPVKHDELQSLHKLFNWSLNFNSIKYSPTMFANRIYELQALGNIILSNYSTAVNNKFPNVPMFTTSGDVKDFLNTINPEEIYERQLQGIRRVMSSETAHHRLSELYEALQLPLETLDRRVAVIVKAKTKKLVEMFENQSYPHKELVLESQFFNNIKARYDMIAFFNEENEYGHFYLEDMVNGFKYTDSDYITKSAYYDSSNKFHEGVEFDYVKQFKDKYKTVFWANAFNAKKLLNLKKSENLKKGFSIDHMQVNEVVTQYQAAEELKLTVIVPVYNNGDFLLNKCFNSLKRSSMFNEMEILLIDDGSSDQNTLRIINELDAKYSNIKTYFYPEGGSGSASRPRNKGIELATTDYITYLDPDNEAVNDGFAKLFKIITKGNFDIALGNMQRFANNFMTFSYHKVALNFNNKSDEVHNKKQMREFLKRNNLRAMSIQALIVKKSVIADNEIKMVEGAVGQDTIFFLELMLNADTLKVTNEDIHIYYAAVEGSSVNKIGKKFFERYLILEKYRIEAYEKYDILTLFLESRFEYYFENWYLKKLPLVDEQELDESIKILSEIFSFYQARKGTFESEVLIEFSKMVDAGDVGGIRDKFCK